MESVTVPEVTVPVVSKPLLEVGAVLLATVVNMDFTNITARVVIDDVPYIFTVDAFAIKDTQPTSVPLAESRDFDMPEGINYEDVLKYWTGDYSRNADGTLKIGSFTARSLGLGPGPDYSFGKKLEITVVKILSNSVEVSILCENKSVKAKKGYATHNPADQLATDNILVSFSDNGQILIYATKRGAKDTPQKKGPDFPNRLCVQGGFLEAYLTVQQNQSAEEGQEAGIPQTGTKLLFKKQMPPRTAIDREPRYKPKCYRRKTDGEIVFFGSDRKSTSYPVLEIFCNTLGGTPVFSGATDLSEVNPDEAAWCTVRDFVSMQTYASEDPEYDPTKPSVAWPDHQNAVREYSQYIIDNWAEISKDFPEDFKCKVPYV